MSKVTPVQTSFNGGEISQRLSGRIDQGIYSIALKHMVGFAPLVEGGMEAMPGTIHVAQAPGPCRLFRFEYNVTQGHVLEFSAGKVRVYTNDVLLEDGGGDPIEVPSPYDYATVQELSVHLSYDVLYCFHRDHQTREFYRDGATSFGMDLLELENGPWESRNTDESLTVSASAVSGNVTLTASASIFAETDVGGLFRMEAGDFGDITAWEPGVTVTVGQLLTANERVYRVVKLGAGGKTGSLMPIHTEGVEWDGIGKGQDVNENSAGGVQLEYVHDRIGVLRITGFTDAQNVSATVLRRLPFSSASGNYAYAGLYYVPSTDGGYIPYNSGGVAYSYGTWRWRFGSFSDTRGWPECGVIWNERLLLAKDSTVYGSAVGDLRNFSPENELGEVSNDMALQATINDPNSIRQLVADEKLLIMTAKNVHTLGPSNAAQGIGPKNLKVTSETNAGTARATAATLDSRTIYIGRGATRLYESDFDATRGKEGALDLTRYARQVGKSGFVEIAVQQEPFNFLWGVRNDGVLACGAYLPDEQVLGWCQRPMADGLAARSITYITDPTGIYDQVWLAVEYDGDWHVVRMAPWREDGESDETGCVLDMALEHDGAAQAAFTHPFLPSQDIQAVADGRVYLEVATDAGGAFTLDQAASRVIAGLPFAAYAESLPFEAGGNNGPAMGKKARINRAWMKVANARGLKFGTPANPECEAQMKDIEQLQGDSVMDEGFAAQTGIVFAENIGGNTRTPRLRVERVAPVQSTILAWGCELGMEQR